MRIRFLWSSCRISFLFSWPIRLAGFKLRMVSVLSPALSLTVASLGTIVLYLVVREFLRFCRFFVSFRLLCLCLWFSCFGGCHFACGGFICTGCVCSVCRENKWKTNWPTIKTIVAIIHCVLKGINIGRTPRYRRLTLWPAPRLKRIMDN